jgi:hypothetical protein
LEPSSSEFGVGEVLEPSSSEFGVGEVLEPSSPGSKEGGIFGGRDSR